VLFPGCRCRRDLALDRTDAITPSVCSACIGGARIAEISSALRLARTFCDAIVECPNFRIESLQRSSTLHTVLARRRIFASRHCLDEVFDVDAANLAASRMVSPILLRTRPAMEGGINCPIMGAPRRTDRSCRRYDQEDKGG
jgi:hypothetical protein